MERIIFDILFTKLHTNANFITVYLNIIVILFSIKLFLLILNVSGFYVWIYIKVCFFILE